MAEKTVKDTDSRQAEQQKQQEQNSKPKSKTPKIILIITVLVLGFAIAMANIIGCEPSEWMIKTNEEALSELEHYDDDEYDDEDDDENPSDSSDNTISADKVTVHYIDIGQGDCIFIRGGKKNMLIDCGEDSESDRVIKYLKDMKIKRLDYVVATHPHSDHMGGMGDVISAFKVGEVIMPAFPDKDIPATRYFEKFMDALEEKNLTVKTAKTGRIIKLGTAQAEIIAPNSAEYGNTNNYSVGIMLTHGENSFLFSGDAEEHAEKEMIASGKLHPVTVYKAGHHGSDTSSSKAFLKAISPKYVVIMCGEGNSYGHPHKSTLKNIKKYTKQIFRTDLCGSIVCESDGSEVAIRTEREV